MKKISFYWGPAVLWAAVIFWFSHIPGLNSGLGLWDFVLRKSAHVVEYFILAALLYRAFKGTWPHWDENRLLWVSLSLGLLYAVSDEIHQAFVPGRGASIGDVLIDACGLMMFALARRLRGKRLNPVVAMTVSVFLIAGCGPAAQFKSAKKAHQKGRHYEAWKAYQAFTASYPKHALAAEALFNVGLLSEQKLRDCFMAKSFYETLLETYPQSDPWARAALLRKNDCPDYFPLLPGAMWVEGDSDTKGGHARIEIEFAALDKKPAPLPGEMGRLRRTFYAGVSKFRTTETIYHKKNSELQEFAAAGDPAYKILLSWPLELGRSWTSRYQGKTFHYEIVAVDAAVSVVAGDYKNCLKVKSTIAGAPGATFEYYAPGVGRVLTTLASGGGEKRNTELISTTSGVPPSYEAWSAQP